MKNTIQCLLKMSLILLIMFLVIAPGHAQNKGVAINEDGSLPDSSAMLDVKAGDKGLLPPRLAVAQIKAISNPAEGLMVYNTDTKKPNYFDGDRWRNYDQTNAFPAIGDSLEGGLVFYIGGTGIHGLICALDDQSSGIQWYNGTYIETGATGVGAGTGQTNTAVIIAAQGAGNYAAEVCDSLDLMGYSDWFLPSRGELGLMFNNLHKNGKGNFVNNWYWSSTEQHQYDAWKVNFFNGSSEGSLKANGNRVRAVRGF